MAAEQGKFSPELTSVLAEINPDEGPKFALGKVWHSLNYLRGGLSSWQDVRFGAMENKVIPGLESAGLVGQASFNEASSWLAYACGGKGDVGLVRAAQLVKAVSTDSNLVIDLIEATKFLLFPADNDQGQQLRQSFNSILIDESLIREGAKFGDLVERTLDIMAWIQEIRPDDARALSKQYDEMVIAGKIVPGQEIKISQAPLVEMETRRPQPAKAVDLEATDDSVLIVPGQELELPSSETDKKLKRPTSVGKFIVGESLAEVAVEDRGTQEMPYLIVISSNAIDFDKLLLQINQRPDLRQTGVQKGELNKIFVTLNHRSFVLSFDTLVEQKRMTVYWEGYEKAVSADARAAFADLCRVATVATNLTLGLPVPEAEEAISSAKPKITRPKW